MSSENVKVVTYPSLAVANTLLKIAEAHGEKLDPMKLQKLVYFAQGFHLAIFDQRLIDEDIEAWGYGPVFPSIYHEFKHYGANFIRNLAKVFDGENFKNPVISQNDKTPYAFLEEVWRAYGGYSGIQLSNITHAEGTPWSAVRKKYGKNVLSAIIPDEEMKKFFSSQLESKK